MDYPTYTVPLVAVAFVLNSVAYVVWAWIKAARDTRKFEAEMAEILAEDAALHCRRMADPYVD